MSFLNGNVFPGYECCIYCGAKEGKLSKEHVIPDSIEGPYIILRGSCEDCAKSTSAFEGHFISKMYPQLRRNLGFKLNSRHRKRERKKEKERISFETAEKGPKDLSQVESELSPLTIAPDLPPAGILRGRPESEIVPRAFLCTNVPLAGGSQSVPAPSKAELKRAASEYQLDRFLKVLAKIAHGFAVTEFGTDSFSQFIPKRIIRLLIQEHHLESTQLTYLVGLADPRFSLPVKASQSRRTHAVVVGIREVNGVDYVVVYIQLFKAVNFPMYEVVVGKASSDLMLRLELLGEIGWAHSPEGKTRIKWLPY